jgi:uncharacterized membrane protein HdeD (DUF308 family)/alpha-beta hydrolase superfamily lysophospholipase
MRGSLQTVRSRPFALVVGLACVVLGVVLATRPFTSLSVLVLLVGVAMIATGISEISGADTSPRPRLGRLLGVGWIVTGVAALAWPDLSVQGVAIFVGVSMIVSGALHVVAGIRGTTDERLASAISGLASVVFGVLALAWPDVTLLVVAVVFGARTVLFGLSRIAWALQRHEPGAPVDATPRRRGRIRRWLRVVGAVVSLLLAVGLASVSAKLREGEPVVDAFYDAPDDVPSQPGQLLRIEPFERGVPDDARAWRILYTTTRDDGIPAVASALVAAPRTLPAGPRPVIAWAHGTTGVARTCAPSVLADPFGSGAFFVLDDVVAQGWVLVATDYVGLGTPGPHPYLIGEGEGRSVLDAVRAARQIDDLPLEERTIVWGHSQGGHAALWAGQLAESYAPDVGVEGVAALAPASDLPGLVDNLGNVPGGSIFATYVLDGYSRTYDDVGFDDYVRPTARVTVREVAGRCLGEPAVFVSVLTSLTTDMSVFSTEPGSGSLGDRLVENTPGGPFAAPLLIGQGATDPLVLPDVQAAFAASLCADGNTVDFRTYDGRDHVGVVQADSPLIPDLLAWTQARLDGETATSTC